LTAHLPQKIGIAIIDRSLQGRRGYLFSLALGDEGVLFVRTVKRDMEVQPKVDPPQGFIGEIQVFAMRLANYTC